jgi:virulence-associated protein VapD
MKYISNILLLILLFGFMVQCKSQDLALHKTYTVSSTPNYKLSAPSSDTVSLTDGIYTKGYFWTQKTTIGWMNKGRVKITIDLGSVEQIGSVDFSTAAGVAGVHFPQSIYIFISEDNKNYQYVGDAANTKNKQYGTYKTKKLSLTSINHPGRYISLVVIPKGKFIFCDEIEVHKSEESNENLYKTLSAENINKLVDSLKTNKDNLNKLQEKITKLFNVSLHGKKIDKEEISNINHKLKRNNLSSYELKKLTNKVDQKYGIYLSKIFHTSYIIEKYNPWEKLNRFHKPEGDTTALSYHFTIPIGGHQYGAFIITNSSNSTQAFSFKIYNSKPSVEKTKLYKVPFVPTEKEKTVADPLVPIASRIKLGAGLSKMIFFKLTGKKKGNLNTSIQILNNDKKTKINIHSKVINIFSGQNRYALNVNVWAYLTYPMLSDRKKSAVKDLQKHHINTIVIPPAAIPGMKSSSFKRLSSYISKFKEVKNILIFAGYNRLRYRKGYKGGEFMSSAWKHNFIKWYNNILKVIHDDGFTNSNVYFYPYDEAHKKKDIRDLKKLIKWAKKAVPGIKFYATLSRKNAVNAILPLIDIAQIYTNHSLTDLPEHHAKIWTYTNGAPARSLSPYKFYRLMAWHAFSKGYTGIGFWNYADDGKGKRLNLINDSYHSHSRHFSVIYDGPDKTIISTRRWEAFSLGIEDYQILHLYAKRFGTKKAKKMVKMVLDQPNNLTLADKIRNKMIDKLF